MRVVTSTVEYLIQCPCGTKLAYEFIEAHDQYMQCPRCGLHHRLNCHHPVLVSEVASVHYHSHIDSGEISKEEIDKELAALNYQSTEQVLENL